MSRVSVDRLPRGAVAPKRFAPIALALATTFVAAGLASPLLAQNAVERNPPPRPERRQAPIVVQEDASGSTDGTPLGVGLSGIALIGISEPVAGRARDGVTIGDIDGAPDAALRAALQPFLGRPLSLALIGEIQSAVTQAWRGSGYPFVSVTVPPQEVTSGVLSLRVVEFRTGGIAVSGTTAGKGDRVRRAVRIRSGDRIDARALGEDLDWLNRVSQRQVGAVFKPGATPGISDLTLEVTEGRNPAFFAGWSNTGSRATGLHRIFAGAGIWVPELNDLTFDYQLTGSPDLWTDLSKIVPSRGSYPSYVSHSGRLVLPTWPRQALEIAPGFVATRERPSAPIAIENTTFELPVVYRTAVSNIVPGLHAGDLYGGVEFKKLYRATFFNGVEVASGEAGVFQIALGWAHGVEDRHGRTQVDIGLRVNPGGIVGGNTDANWSAFSGGRVTDASYVYAAGSITRLTLLPCDMVWGSRVAGLLAGQPLPDTERLALGGLYAVRGYGIDDATVDTGVVWRNELRLPQFPLIGAAANGLSDNVSPFVFADIGHGTNLSTAASTTLGSVGAGFDYTVAGRFGASFVAAYTLANAAITPGGAVTIQAQIAARY